MKVVSPELYSVLLNLVGIDELKDFCLAGGTNLALRFGHRVSTDIDLFTNHIMDYQKMKRIISSLEKGFGEKLTKKEIRRDRLKRLSYLEAYIQENGRYVKVDLISNVPRLYDPIDIDGIRYLSMADIGLLKLDSFHKRAVWKDLYDLDFITERIPLEKLWRWRNEKVRKYHVINVLHPQRHLNPSFLKHVDKESPEVVLMDQSISREDALKRWHEKVDRLIQGLHPNQTKCVTP